MEQNNTIKGIDENMESITLAPIFVPTTIEFVPLGLILLIICIFGLIGNTLSALVLIRPKMVSTYSTTTLGLTFFDVVYLLTKLFRYALAAFLTHYSIGTGYTNFFLPTIGPGLRAVTFTAHTGSTYFTILVALDRYIAVTRPIQSKILWTRLRVFVCCGLVTIFSILFNLTRWWEFSTQPVQDDDGQIVAYDMKVTDLRKSLDYKLIYTFWLYFFVMFLIPFVSLSYLNYSIGVTIWKASRKREELSSKQQQDNSYALMLIAVVIVFLICSVDYLVLDWLDFYNIPIPEFWYSLGNVLLTMNSAINFIIYCVFGKRFRDEFFKMMKEFSSRRSHLIRRLTQSTITTSNSGKGTSKWYSNPPPTPETSSSCLGSDSEERRF